MIYRYFCLHRPPSLGPIPDGATNVISFRGRMNITDTRKGVNYEAWGFIEYDHRLSPDDIRNYELSHGVKVRCV